MSDERKPSPEELAAQGVEHKPVDPGKPSPSTQDETPPQGPPPPPPPPSPPGVGGG